MAIVSSSINNSLVTIHFSFFGKAFEQAVDKTQSRAELDFFDTHGAYLGYFTVIYTQYVILIKILNIKICH